MNTKVCQYCYMQLQVQCHIAHVASCSRNTKACKYCGSHFQVGNLANHKSRCSMNTKVCRYCRTSMQVKQLAAHETSCGNLKIMFHGTSQANALSIEKTKLFTPSTGGMLGPGVYASTDIKKARSYGPVVFKLEVRLGKVKKIDRHGHPLQKNWQSNGYDTAWVPAKCGMVASGLTENCIKDPSRIRIIGRV
eukprot:GEMP01061120.1.p1 GENE.GEMP01061120.1~~GEMP01061120.1.p1  ORF type:complete len:192 (+),score=6.76 GEMP01061120.1:475-1050(+)